MFLRYLYTLTLYLLTPAVLVRLLWRGRRNPAYWQRWGERFGYVQEAGGRSPVWIHAVSVGEVQAAQGLIRELQRHYPAHALFVTTTTPTGSAQVRKLFGDSVSHAYLPYDLPGAVRRFLDRVRPELAVVMETELWPNLFAGCARRNVPVVIANARLSPRSMTGYRRVRPLVRETLRNIRLIAAQGKADAGRFISLGASPEQVEVTGSVKFDQQIPSGLVEKAALLRRQLGEERPVWIAASTHQGEDEQILDAFQRLQRGYPDCLLILVPRHPERFDRVAELCRQRGFSVVRRTEGVSCQQDTDIFLGDTLGELLLFYAASDVAFVGGSLVPTGGHNMLEPAALEKPVITGPHLFNFSEIASAMEEAGAAYRVDSAAQLAALLERLLSDPQQRDRMGSKGGQLVERNRGALQNLLVLLKRYLG